MCLPGGAGAIGTPPNVISVDGLCKRFGSTVAIDDVSFRVERGEVLGFVGPNGAGKTTTLRIIAGYLAADRGRVSVAEIDVERERAHACAQIGYLPESAPLYDDMRVEDFVRFRARIKGVAAADLRERVDSALRKMAVADRRRQVIGTLSKGYRQRVAMADALVATPPVLILDEPTAGLDPVQVRELRALLADLAGEHTILLSSHRLDEVEALAARVVVLVGGRVVAAGTPREIAGDRSLEDVFVELAT